MRKIFTTLLIVAIVATISAQTTGKIILTTSKPSVSYDPNSKLGIAVDAESAAQSSVWIDANNNQTREEPTENPKSFGSWDIKDYAVGSQTMTIHGNITELRAELGQIIAVDFSKSNLQLAVISLKINNLSGVNATNLVNSLPDRTGVSQGKLSIFDTSTPNERNIFTTTDVAVAVAKNWAVVAWNGTGEENYPGAAPVVTGKILLTTLKASIAEDPNSKIGIGLSASPVDQSGVWVDANNNDIREEPSENPTGFQLWNLTNFSVGSQTMSINGNVAEVTVKWGDISLMDFSGSNQMLTKIEVFANKIKGLNATKLMNSLPDRKGITAGTIILFDASYEWEENQFSKSDVAIATAKNWDVMAKSAEGNEVPYTGISTGFDDNKGLKYNIQYANNSLLLSNLEEGIPVRLYTIMGQMIFSKSSTSTMDIELPQGMYILKIANEIIKINTRR